MLNSRQKAILRAYGMAQLTLKSQAIVLINDGYEDYITLPCDGLWDSYRHMQDYEVVLWMHPHIHPDWDEYYISEEDYTKYMHKRFSILFKSKED